MEEKLFMQGQKKWLNVPRGKVGCLKQLNPRFWNSAKMCSMADLASGFGLSFNVGVACDLGNENKKHYRQA